AGDLSDTSRARGHDRRSAGKRLHDRKAKPLQIGWVRDHPGPAIPGGELLVAKVSTERNLAAEPALGQVGERRGSLSGEDELNRWHTCLHSPDGLDQVGDSL